MRNGIVRNALVTGGLGLALLSFGRCPVVRAQAPAPTVPAPVPPARSVEERLQKLEAMNQRLLEQNHRLGRQLEAVNWRVSGPPARVAQGSNPDGERSERVGVLERDFSSLTRSWIIVVS